MLGARCNVLSLLDRSYAELPILYFYLYQHLDIPSAMSSFLFLSRTSIGFGFDLYYYHSSPARIRTVTRHQAAHLRAYILID